MDISVIKHNIISTSVSIKLGYPDYYILAQNTKPVIVLMVGTV